MQRYSENQIRELHSEFKSHKKYADKLAFFDQFFGIIPFIFPDFDPRLRYFFQKEKTDELAEIYRNERNNPGLTERKFFFGESFIFNIKPANSNSAAYSNYILSSFLSRSLSNRINLPGKKRKFIELYLYAQGIIYSNYLGSLKRSLHVDFFVPVDLQKPANLDLPGKLDLLNELGILDFLKTRYSGMDSVSFENKMAEILCLLTGEYIGQKESVLKILSTMNRKNQNEILKRVSSGFYNKTAHSSVRK
jgi:hypothetical protein